MTKYILIGGYPTKPDDGGKTFVDELIDGLDQPIRILICLFARPEETWQEVFENDKIYFGSMIRDRKFILELAKSSTFIEQVRNTDVVYFRGGRTKQLMRRLEECPGWEVELEDKTVAGTSAGVNFLATYYYSLDDLEICQGLGILPIKALVHYGSDYNAPNIDWEKVTLELEEYGDKDMEVLKLAEGEFVVREQYIWKILLAQRLRFFLAIKFLRSYETIGQIFIFPITGIFLEEDAKVRKRRKPVRYGNSKRKSTLPLPLGGCCGRRPILQSMTPVKRVIFSLYTLRKKK